MALEKCSKKLERSTRVSPPPLRLPPNAITSEQEIRYHRNQRRGGMGGQALSPPDLTCPVISYPDKRNSSKPKKYYFYTVIPKIFSKTRTQTPGRPPTAQIIIVAKL